MRNLASEVGSDSNYPAYALAHNTGQPSYVQSSGHKLNEYKLKATDTQQDKRNFPGTAKNTYYDLDDMKETSKYEQAGTTDTDSATDRGNKEGYAKIYRKKGKIHPASGKGHKRDTW